MLLGILKVSLKKRGLFKGLVKNKNLKTNFKDCFSGRIILFRKDINSQKSGTNNSYLPLILLNTG